MKDVQERPDSGQRILPMIFLISVDRFAEVGSRSVRAEDAKEKEEPRKARRRFDSRAPAQGIVEKTLGLGFDRVAKNALREATQSPRDTAPDTVTNGGKSREASGASRALGGTRRRDETGAGGIRERRKGAWKRRTGEESGRRKDKKTSDEESGRREKKRNIKGAKGWRKKGEESGWRKKAEGRAKLDIEVRGSEESLVESRKESVAWSSVGGKEKEESEEGRRIEGGSEVGDLEDRESSAYPEVEGRGRERPLEDTLRRCEFPEVAGYPRKGNGGTDGERTKPVKAVRVTCRWKFLRSTGRERRSPRATGSSNLGRAAKPHGRASISTSRTPRSRDSPLLPDARPTFLRRSARRPGSLAPEIPERESDLRDESIALSAGRSRESRDPLPNECANTRDPRRRRGSTSRLRSSRRAAIVDSFESFPRIEYRDTSRVVEVVSSSLHRSPTRCEDWKIELVCRDSAIAVLVFSHDFY
ncbi:hypothetical protein KM043_014583 [Ampulex compressa]|nr:hypothetical protein KM043_014583 [Ampulex compressa]